MTAKRLLVILVVVLVLGVILLRSTRKTIAPQPNTWPAPTTSTETSGSAATTGVINLPANPSYIIWDYSREKGFFIGYLPEKNQLAQITVTGDVKTITTLGDLTILSLSVSPKGDRILLYVLHDNGNQQYVYLDLKETNPQPKTLPYTIQAASWLPDGKILYIFNDRSNLTLSQTSDFTLSTWSMITPLNAEFMQSSLNVSPDGSYALITSHTTGNAVIAALTQKSLRPVDGMVRSIAWTDTGHIALLQGKTGETDSLIVYDPATANSHTIPNATLPYLALKIDDFLVGITPNYQDSATSNIDTLVVNLTSGASKTGTLGISDVGIPTQFFADPLRSQLIAGTSEKITSISYKELLNRVAKP